MMDSLSRIGRVRGRRLRQAAALVEARRRALDAAKTILAVRDHALHTLDILSEQAAACLAEEASDPALRMTVLARMETLDAHRVNGLKSRHVEAAAVDGAASDLRQARLALGRAQARLDAVDTLTLMALTRIIRRREHLAELDQGDRHAFIRGLI